MGGIPREHTPRQTAGSPRWQPARQDTKVGQGFGPTLVGTYDGAGRCEKHSGMDGRPKVHWWQRLWGDVAVTDVSQWGGAPLPSLSLCLCYCLPWWSALLHFCHLQMVLKWSGNIVSGPTELLTDKFFLCGMHIPYRKSSEERTRQNASFCQLQCCFFQLKCWILGK